MFFFVCDQSGGEGGKYLGLTSVRQARLAQSSLCGLAMQQEMKSAERGGLVLYYMA